jgi:cell division protein DivIC
VSESIYGDFKDRQQEGVWHYLNRAVKALIAVAVITIIICAFIPELKRQRDETATLDQLKLDIEKQEAIHTRRSREVDLLQHDPGYMETVARDRLDLMKPGETIYRIEPQNPDKSDYKLEH